MNMYWSQYFLEGLIGKIFIINISTGSVPTGIKKSEDEVERSLYKNLLLKSIMIMTMSLYIIISGTPIKRHSTCQSIEAIHSTQ